MTPASNAAAPGRLNCNGKKWQLFPFPLHLVPRGREKASRIEAKDGTRKRTLRRSDAGAVTRL